ncbi:AraC family transcriptional regulator [Pseudoxanthomonas sp. NC8]|nr:AraC family transcriptional regulator [Pseudoxanthomonas sp. NC8]
MLNRRRIAYACRRLTEPDAGASIPEISGECGFASLGPLNRAFKAEMGCTPTAYRASRQAGEDRVSSAGPMAEAGGAG